MTPFHQGEGSSGRYGLTFGKQPLRGFGRVTLQVPSPVLNKTINCSEFVRQDFKLVFNKAPLAAQVKQTTAPRGSSPGPGTWS